MQPDDQREWCNHDYPQAFLRPLFVIDGWRVSLMTTYYRTNWRWPAPRILAVWSLSIANDAALRERDERILRAMRTYHVDVEDDE